MYTGARTFVSARGGWGGGGGLGTPCAQKKGVHNAIRMHDTLLKQVSLGFNSPIVSASKQIRYRALSRTIADTCLQQLR